MMVYFSAKPQIFLISISKFNNLRPTLPDFYVLNPIPYGGGNIAPLAENRPLSVKKIRIFKNEPSENALPTPRNPTYTLRFHPI